MENNLISDFKVLVSIIIPCYNSGEFLPDALASVLDYPALSSCEVIVIDDGSTDALTLQVLKEAQAQGCQVIYQSNKGPAAARNKGISCAAGKYILFLDSDNKIRHEYINEGVRILDSNPEVGVVYGKPAFFGTTTIQRFTVQAFDPYKMLIINSVDMCAMVRKRVWEDVGKLDEERLLIGHEDWEFWIRIIGAGWKFYFVDKILFDYRVRENSLITKATQPLLYNKVLEYIYKKNYLQYNKYYISLYNEHSSYSFDKNNPLRSFFKFMYLKYVKK